MRLRDVVKSVDNNYHVGVNVNSIANKIKLEIKRIEKNIIRDSKRVTITGISERIVVELKKLAKQLKLNEQDDTEIFATCARNLFELNLTLRFILISDANLNKWMSQRASDEIDILEGIQKLSYTKDDPNYIALSTRIDVIKQICKKHGVELGRHLTVKKLAEEVGNIEEYEAFFKLYSKYVHPTSWLVHSQFKEVHSFEYRYIFITRSQLYGADSLGKLLEVK